MKTRASNDAPATYWDQDEQEKLLCAAFHKWAKRGDVWSVAAEKVGMQEN
jgi:hypothetical protein